MSYNKIILVGHCTRDIELKYTQSGSAIANTAIATSRKFTQNGEKKEEVCFVDITFFGKIAEIANQYLHKGSKILADGRLKLDQWQDQNGQKRSKHSVIVETMQMLDAKVERFDFIDKKDSSTSHHQQNDNQPYSRPRENGHEQQQSYQAPQPQYQNQQGQQVTQKQYQQNQQQNAPKIPPEINIDEDGMPF